MGDHRAAPADPRRQPRAHRRARGGHDRAGSARARHGLWWHPAVPRGAGASGRGPSPGRSRRRRSRARLGARGARTSRSWPGSTQRRRRCRWPRRSPPPGPRSIARCSPRPCPSRPGSWTRASGLWSTRASWSGSRAVRPATTSGTSCCARSRTSCSRPRGAARCTTGSAMSSPATSRATGMSSRRTSSVRNATRRRRSPTSTRQSGRGGVGRWTRPGRTSRGRSTSSCRWPTTRRAIIARSSCACAGGSSPCPPRARAAPMRPWTSTAASSWRRPIPRATTCSAR